MERPDSSLFWLHRKGYLQGLFWSVLVCMSSALNDMIVKYVGLRLDPSQVAFFRFLFSTLTLLPFMMAGGRRAFQTNHLGIHSLRSLLLFLGLFPWCYGVIAMPLALSTTLSFTTPLFVVVLAAVFLKESVGWQRACATLVGFGGIVVSARPSSAGWDIMAIVLVLSCVMFATLDVINKKLLIADEGLLSMMFYSALGTAVLSFPFAFLSWKMPQLREIMYLAILGGSANLILYFLLKSFAACDVSALQPVRYVELLFSGTFGWLIFQQLPGSSTLFGAILIVPATFYIAYYETQQQRLKERAGEPVVV